MFESRFPFGRASTVAQCTKRCTELIEQFLEAELINIMWSAVHAPPLVMHDRDFAIERARQIAEDIADDATCDASGGNNNGGFNPDLPSGGIGMSTGSMDELSEEFRKIKETREPVRLPDDEEEEEQGAENGKGKDGAEAGTTLKRPDVGGRVAEKTNTQAAAAGGNQFGQSSRLWTPVMRGNGDSFVVGAGRVAAGASAPLAWRALKSLGRFLAPTAFSAPGL